MSTRISVITATFNSAVLLPRLAKSLMAQSFRDFEWIVIDGGSVDGTVAYLRAFAEQNPWCRYISEPDYGIYDAINRGIRQMSSAHYVVAGSDDTFAPDALQTYVACLDRTPQLDIIVANVEVEGRLRGGFYPQRSWLGHQRAFPGSHSIGMLIRAGLHTEFGFYSNRFPMLADGFFLKKVLRSGRGVFVAEPKVMGEFALGGLSSSNKLQSLAEGWQIQMLTERSRLVQLLVFAAKVALQVPRLLKTGG